MDMNKNKDALRRVEKKNPLRRAFTDCHGWVRDALAQKGEWLWCEPCSDWARVTAVAE
jgi:hypothetical protein